MPPNATPPPDASTDVSAAAAPAARATATSLHRDVLDWFAEHARDLPWREPSTDAWGVLVSEIMLQQTPVSRVVGPWREWLARWPRPADLAAAPTADALRAWGRLGYPRRALRLQECAAAIVARHGGQVPDDEAALRALPGIGEYTAAAVRAFAFGRRAVVLDTNVRRVLDRVVAGAALPSPTLTRAERERAAALVPDDDATSARWNVAVMELGALVCTARAPRCEECPVRARCAWRTAGYPPDVHAARRRTQAWHGTDRQVRGRLMRHLRESTAPATREALVEAADAAPAQALACLTALVADGLVAQPEPGTYTLGGGARPTVET